MTVDTSPEQNRIRAEKDARIAASVPAAVASTLWSGCRCVTRMVELPRAVPAGTKSVRLELSGWTAKG